VKAGGNGTVLTGTRLVELMEKLFRLHYIYDKCVKIGFPRQLLDSLLESREFCTCHFDDAWTAIPTIQRAVTEAGFTMESIEKVHPKEGEGNGANGGNGHNSGGAHNGNGGGNGAEYENGTPITDYTVKVTGSFDGQIIEYELFKNTLSSIDFLNMYELKKAIRVLDRYPVVVENQDNASEEANNRSELIDIANRIGRKGLTVQRYKGLGEMNPEQLWSTTMDPDTRTLYRIDLEDVVEADRIFTVLMGGEVEPRRKFIQENAFNVRNLDV